MKIPEINPILPIMWKHHALFGPTYLLIPKHNLQFAPAIWWYPILEVNEKRLEHEVIKTEISPRIFIAHIPFPDVEGWYFITRFLCAKTNTRLHSWRYTTATVTLVHTYCDESELKKISSADVSPRSTTTTPRSTRSGAASNEHFLVDTGNKCCWSTRLQPQGALLYLQAESDDRAHSNQTFSTNSSFTHPLNQSG